MSLLIFILLARSCYTDIRYRIIENKCVISILLINVLFFLMGKEQIYLSSSIVILSIGTVCVLSHCIGAGDVKLLAVLGLTFPLRELLDFIFLVAVSGLPLILVIYCLHHFTRGKFSKTLPYGVAITCGYLLKIFI